MSAWRVIANGITPQSTKTREKYWRHWVAYTHQCKTNPYLTGESKLHQAILLTGYAARVRAGAFGLRNEVKVQTVSNALAAISKTIELAGQQSPVYQAPETYILPIQRCLEGFRRQDPPAIPQLAVPVTLPNEALKHAYTSTNPQVRATGDLIVVAFFYLLRSGEYTNPRQVKENDTWKRATRTRQFRVQDVGFHKDAKILPRNSPLPLLLKADSATLKISNQKNGRMGQTIHHQSTGDNGAVASLARRIHHILSNGGTDSHLICAYYQNQAWHNVTSQMIVKAVRQSAVRLKLQTQGIDPDIIGAHSLRAGGAMALKLQKYPDTTIQKMGRWTSTTWLQYIHNQIAHISEGVAQKMSEELPFLNIGMIEPPSTTSEH